MILITGATGFIGQRLGKDLLERGEQVRILAREPGLAKGLFPKAEVVKGDILDRDSLKRALRGTDQVVHLAALISYTTPGQELWKVNVDGTRNLVELAKDAEKFLFSSSVSVYGQTREPATEEQLPSPRTPYGESKLEGERLVRNSGLPHACFRIGVVYGPGSPIWAEILRFFGKGFPIPRTKNVTNLIQVGDVSRAFRIGLKKGKGVYNIAAGRSVPFVELASLLSYHLGKKPRFWPSGLVRSLAALMGKGREIEAFTLNREYSIEKARKELGFSPAVRLEAGLKEMVEWYKGLG